jgi:hypothetical protein
MTAQELLGQDHVVVFYRLDPDGTVVESRIVSGLSQMKAEGYLHDMAAGRGFVIDTTGYAPGYWHRAAF